MKTLFFTMFLLGLLYGDQQKTTLSVSQTYYDSSPTETQFSGISRYEVNSPNNVTAKLVLEYLYNTQHKKQYIRLNEAFVRKEFKNYSYTIGRVIRYWGELEGYNITDVFNQKNYLYDPFNKDKKVGSWAFLTSRYIGNNTFEIGIKFFESNQKFPKTNAPFYPFTISYQKDLGGKYSRWNPTLHARYSFETTGDIESETNFIYQQGFDNKRALNLSPTHELNQIIYKSKKYMMHSNIINGDTIIKLEAAYTDVEKTAPISDYYQVGVGIEKNIYNIMGIDVSLHGEYYKYGYKEKKQENVDISELYNNDVFLAARLTFNDTGDSEIKAGVLIDLDTNEKVYKLEAKTRIKDQIILHGDLLHIEQSKNSIVSTFKDTTRGNVDISYNF